MTSWLLATQVKQVEIQATFLGTPRFQEVQVHKRTSACDINVSLGCAAYLTMRGFLGDSKDQLVVSSVQIFRPQGGIPDDRSVATLNFNRLQLQFWRLIIETLRKSTKTVVREKMLKKRNGQATTKNEKCKKKLHRMKFKGDSANVTSGLN